MKKLNNEKGAATASIVWHYTTVDELKSILRAGTIKPGRSRISDGETPAVWFSPNGDWHPMPNDITDLPNSGQIARIGILKDCPGIITWEEFKRTSVVGWLDSLCYEATGNHLGWRASFDPVDSEHWCAVQVNLGSGWANGIPGGMIGIDDWADEKFFWVKEFGWMPVRSDVVYADEGWAGCDDFLGMNPQAISESDIVLAPETASKLGTRLALSESLAYFM